MSYTDAAIRIPLFKLIIGIYLLAGLGSLLFIVRGRIIGILASLIFLIILNISQALIPALVQSIIVEPNQLVKETPFIGHNIAATRAAYDLENVEERTISAEQQLTADDIAQHDLTIKNVRLWDRAPLLSTFSQIQEIRTYYQFSSITNDRYTLGDELRQIMLSPRDLEAENLPNRNWINEHLIFTHGYGAVAGPVNQVTQEGLPVLFVKDIPPQSDLSELSISQPALYYSQRVNDYVIVNTKLDEFDYPQGDTNVSTRYTGSGGVQLSSLWQRFLFSLRFGSEKILLSNDLTNESRILYYRQFQRRAEKLLPFLTFDRDPYLVIADGKLYWLLDAYTVSSLYPYSQPVLFNEQSVNYVRNSIKIVIDAYNGTVGFYRTDDNDPIIATLSRIFPNVFKDLSAMPDNLRAHIRYPEDLFTTQAVLYTVYHMQDPQIFYNREDQWEIAGIIDQRSNQQANISPRHLVMRLPGEETAEYIFMLPFTPKGKDNLSAWMAARNDGDHYGKLLVFSFPKDRLVFGPKQIIDRINQDTEISQQLSLWDQRGSQVIQGPLLVIPIEGSLLYVRPLYLKAERGNIPELKRVMVAYENSIVMRRRLEDGLAAIFSSDSADKETEGAEAAESPSTPLATEKEELIRTANDHYQAALQAQREGNWSLYGEEIRKLGEVLKRLQ